MSDEDFDARIAKTIRDNAEKMEILAGKFAYVLRRSFSDHEKALASIEAMSRNSGEKATYDALRLEPEIFGNAPIGAAEAADALEERKKLALIFTDYRDLRNENDALRETQDMRAKARKSDGDDAGSELQTQNLTLREQRQRYMASWQLGSGSTSSNARQMKPAVEDSDD